MAGIGTPEYQSPAREFAAVWGAAWTLNCTAAEHCPVSFSETATRPAPARRALLIRAAPEARLPVAAPATIVTVMPMRIAVVRVGERRRNYTGREGSKRKHRDDEKKDFFHDGLH